MTLTREESEALIELLKQAEDLIADQRTELDGLAQQTETERALFRTSRILFHRMKGEK